MENKKIKKKKKDTEMPGEDFLWSEQADNTRISYSLSFRVFPVNEGQWREKIFD